MAEFLPTPPVSYVTPRCAAYEGLSLTIRLVGMVLRVSVYNILRTHQYFA